MDWRSIIIISISHHRVVAIHRLLLGHHGISSNPSMQAIIIARASNKCDDTSILLSRRMCLDADVPLWGNIYVMTRCKRRSSVMGIG